MEIRVNKIGTINHKARCVQIRDADWVCRTITQKLPHFSTTKQQPRIEKFLLQHAEVLKIDKPFNTLSDMMHHFDCFIFPEGHAELQEKVMNIRRMVRNFGSKRVQADEEIGTGYWRDHLFETLHMLKNFKLGNCTENAIAAELILKINGMHNACCAILEKEYKEEDSLVRRSLDHLICVVNRDGSDFNGNITSETIIVDPWLDKADFARNTEQYYRNECSKFFELKDEDIIKYLKVSFVDINDAQIIAKEFPEFVFKNKKRGFMLNQ